MHILMPVFLFPPFCCPGSMRLGRFVRHFCEWGGRVTVVTAALEDYQAGFPKRRQLDMSLVDNLPSGVRVVRTKAVRPGRFVDYVRRLRLGRIHRALCLPDKVIPWKKAAVPVCRSILDDEDVDCIYSSSNPYTNHLVAMEMAESFHKPWVAEFQDPWVEGPSHSWETFLHYLREKGLQKKVLSRASKIIMNTHVARDQLLEFFPRLSPHKVEVVVNSFDANLRNSSQESGETCRSSTMTVVHVGTMYGVSPIGNPKEKRPLLNRIRRACDAFGRYYPRRVDNYGRSPWYLCHALQRLIAEQPEMRDRIKLLLVGAFEGVSNPPESLRALLEGLRLSDVVEYVGEVSHHEALRHMHSADVLLLPQIYSIDGRPCPWVAAKTYEYLASGRPILGLLPPGDMRDLVLKSGLGTVAPPNDPEEIAGKILELYQEHTNGGIHRTPDREFIEQFRSDRLARKVWDIFEEVTGKKPELAVSHG